MVSIVDKVTNGANLALMAAWFIDCSVASDQLERFSILKTEVDLV